jgi:DNA sulfur modification protein DndB
MGGHTYSSFSIEPARLLKMAYILHRNQANSELMPTYQRLIKKSRLKKVATFVEDGGFFPNSVILNIESSKKGKGDLQFDLAPKSAGASKIGILKLPQTYRAAYVIDGQHRLYGYADSKRAETDLIPVVAFVDLDQSEQVRLFMQINENQQAVPKNLQNTLNADLLWDSDDYTKRAQALRLRIATHLGEQKTSPLYGRVIIGENAKSSVRCITIDAIKNGLLRGNFIGKFNKAGVTEHGSYYAADFQTTFDALTPFLEATFDYLRDGLDTQWKLGNAEGGFVFINNGIEALLRLLSDVVDHVIEHADLSPLTATPKELLEACCFFLEPLIEHLSGLGADEGLAYRKLYGSGAGLRYYRQLQQAVQAARKEFNPAGLEEWVSAQDKKFVSEAREIVSELELFFKADIRDRLQVEYGKDWHRLGVPKKVKTESGHRAVEENAKDDLPTGQEVEPWDMMHLIDYREILTQNEQLWESQFKRRYTRPEDADKNTSRKNQTTWFVQLNDIRNKAMHVRGIITEEEFAFLQELKSWLLLNEIDNDL